MEYYEDLAEMYVGDDVSPDFYGWVFPKCDHVAVGTGTVINKPAIKKYQTATRWVYDYILDWECEVKFNVLVETVPRTRFLVARSLELKPTPFQSILVQEDLLTAWL